MFENFDFFSNIFFGKIRESGKKQSRRAGRRVMEMSFSACSSEEEEENFLLSSWETKSNVNLKFYKISIKLLNLNFLIFKREF